MTHEVRDNRRWTTMAFIAVGNENNTPIELYYEDQGAGQPIVRIHVVGLGQALAEAPGRKDVIVGAVRDQGRIAAGAAVLEPRRHTGVGRHRRAGSGDVLSPGDSLLADPAAEVLVEVVKVRVEHFPRQTPGLS